MPKGIDRAVPFTKIGELLELKKHGYTFICRYTSKSAWKRLTPAEVKLIGDAGLYLVNVYQNAHNKPEFFTESAGVSDARDAIARAKLLGQPANTPIYFPVDFDAGASATNMAKVYAFFNGVVNTLRNSGYDVGVYGSYGVCDAVAKKFGLKYIWQTRAWSKGKILSNANLYQHAVDVKLPENPKFGNVDLNISNGAGGGWIKKN